MNRTARQTAFKNKEDEIKNIRNSVLLSKLMDPLTVIMGFSDLLLKKQFGKLTEEQEEIIELIKTSGKKLTKAINIVLDLQYFKKLQENK